MSTTTTSTAEEKREKGYLKFSVVWCSAPPVKDELCCSNLLVQDKSKTYCTLTPSNINILLKYTGGNNGFTLSEFEARSPEGKSSPLKNGLVFVSHKPFEANQTNRFNNFTKQKFEDLEAKSDELRPVLYFEIPRGSSSTLVVLPRVIEGAYILVKLLSTWSGSVFHAEFLGFIGTDGTLPKPSGPIILSPLDIMSTVFHLLDLNTFLNCALVSKKWNAWANSDAVWSRLFDKYKWSLVPDEVTTDLKRLYLTRALPHVNDWTIKGPGKDYFKQEDQKPLRDVYSIVLGTYLSGKTSLVENWAGRKFNFNDRFKNTVIQYKRRRINFMDVSGAEGDVNNWHGCYHGVDVVVWVVDGMNVGKFEDTKKLMHDALSSIFSVRVVPVGIFVSKQDLPGALDARDVIQKLELGKLRRELNISYVYLQSGVTYDQQDEGVWKLLDWIAENCHKSSKKKPQSPNPLLY